MSRRGRRLVYFSTWGITWAISCVLSAINMDWQRSSLTFGILLYLSACLMHLNLSEIVSMSTVSFFYRVHASVRACVAANRSRPLPLSSTPPTSMVMVPRHEWGHVPPPPSLVQVHRDWAPVWRQQASQRSDQGAPHSHVRGARGAVDRHIILGASSESQSFSVPSVSYQDQQSQDQRKQRQQQSSTPGSSRSRQLSSAAGSSQSYQQQQQQQLPRTSTSSRTQRQHLQHSAADNQHLRPHLRPQQHSARKHREGGRINASQQHLHNAEHHSSRSSTASSRTPLSIVPTPLDQLRAQQGLARSGSIHAGSASSSMAHSPATLAPPPMTRARLELLQQVPSRAASQFGSAWSQPSRSSRSSQVYMRQGKLGLVDSALSALAKAELQGGKAPGQVAPAIDPSDLTLLINYNLLATSEEDIDECLRTMYNAYWGNLSPNVAAVLVSATGDEALRAYELRVRDAYRAKIYAELVSEGQEFCAGHWEDIHQLHLEHLWAKYARLVGPLQLRQHVDTISKRFATGFMVVHRVTRVLKKCGQYQDLMLLSEGVRNAYTYTDRRLYGSMAREAGQPMFRESEDVDFICGRGYDYTLVADADTGVVPGSMFRLLRLAALHPERGIIQPAIKIIPDEDGTLFQYLEVMRQDVYEALNKAVMHTLGQCGFFGKALIRNKVYVEQILGTPDKLIERVPIDVLSHDTFEAACLRPLYAGDIFLLEAASLNYLTWHIRETRWNLGEIILACYFMPFCFGRPMRWLQAKLQPGKFVDPQLRTPTKLDFVSSYIAHSALRQMVSKPVLLLYVAIHMGSFGMVLRYGLLQLGTVFAVLLLWPKLAVMNSRNWHLCLLETAASLVQYTPEAVIGTIRLASVLVACASGKSSWRPQKSVEDEFRRGSPFVTAFMTMHLQLLLGAMGTVLMVLFLPGSLLALTFTCSLLVLPVFTAVTALPAISFSGKLRAHDYYAGLA